MGYAFISYSSKQSSLADAMRELLNKNGVETWMAPYDIPAGSVYAAVINDAVSNCSCFVLMLTNDSQNSEWVGKEVNAAITNGNPVVPVLLENIELNSSMKFYLNDRHFVPVHKIDESSEEIQKILKSIISMTENKMSKGEAGISKLKSDDSAAGNNLNKNTYEETKSNEPSSVNTFTEAVNKTAQAVEEKDLSPSGKSEDKNLNSMIKLISTSLLILIPGIITYLIAYYSHIFDYLNENKTVGHTFSFLLCGVGFPMALMYMAWQIHCIINAEKNKKEPTKTLYYLFGMLVSFALAVIMMIIAPEDDKIAIFMTAATVLSVVDYTLVCRYTKPIRFE